MSPDERAGDARGEDRTRRPVDYRSVVLEGCVQLTFHAVLATALFFLFSGHNSPGGGFIGGLVAGTAFVLRYLVSSGAGVSGDVRVRPETVLGLGLLLAAGTAVTPWFLGGQMLESDYLYLDLPVLGELPLASVLAFDTGVFLIVIGIVLSVLSTLGAQAEASLGAVTSVPGTSQPGTSQPGAAQPGTAQPGAAQPGDRYPDHRRGAS